MDECERPIINLRAKILYRPMYARSGSLGKGCPGLERPGFGRQVRPAAIGSIVMLAAE